MKKILTAFVNLVAIVLSTLVPKSKKIIICGGWFGKRFADNSKSFFLYLSENKERLGLDKVIFVTDNEKIIRTITDAGFCSMKKDSLVSKWYHLRAKYHVVDQGPNDVYKYLSVKAKRINLWHGFPLK